MMVTADAFDLIGYLIGAFGIGYSLSWLMYFTRRTIISFLS
jgi:hypothetical protein